AQPQGAAARVPASPRTGDPPADRVPAPRGETAGPHPGRAAHRHLQPGRKYGNFPPACAAGVGDRGLVELGRCGGQRENGAWGGAVGGEHCSAVEGEIGVQDNYGMTEAQAEAVVRMQLGQLAALERDEIFKEYNNLRGQILSYEELLGSERNILAVIRADLVE